MKISIVFCCFILGVTAQLPPRITIPGALLVGQGPARPAPFRNGTPPRRQRPPPPNAIPVRPVIEETDDLPPQAPPSVGLDEEAARLFQSAVREAEQEQAEAPRPVQFRPERPVPVLRQDIREGRIPIRGGVEGGIPKALLRPELREEEPPIRQPIRQQVRQHVPAPQPVRQPTRGHAPRPHYSEGDENHPERQRARKPPVQILRKYRTDNPDGSITWGFENEDGTFKEETLGVDCVTRGKYGYIDPDGVRREYTYETGNKCDEPEEEEELLPERPQSVQPQPRKPLYRPQGP